MQTSIYSYCAAIVLYKIQNAERENNATFNTNLGYNLEEVSPTKQKNKIEEVKHTLPRSNYNKFYWMTYKKRKDKRKNREKNLTSILLLAVRRLELVVLKLQENNKKYNFLYL